MVTRTYGKYEFRIKFLAWKGNEIWAAKMRYEGWTHLYIHAILIHYSHNARTVTQLFHNCYYFVLWKNALKVVMWSVSCFVKCNMKRYNFRMKSRYFLRNDFFSTIHKDDNRARRQYLTKWKDSRYISWTSERSIFY